ncbi:hypothetical protein [Actinoplanes sp. NPDC026623]|uniref:hypothetical protein n=1 Tax=Actinoplanes sp. NPDC026623 TaxID=3155610 RepID=UPI0033E0ABC7
MSAEKSEVTEEREPTEGWRQLPDRVKPEDAVESVPAESVHEHAGTAQGPNSAWTFGIVRNQ